MSLDAGYLRRATSPASSGSSSPINPRPRFGAEDVISKKDKNYRRYASAVERALSLFDTTLQEWADYISFLARLLKALQSRPPEVAEVPHKAVVARRLAQCLNPSLPSGVHQKTIETYTYIFNVLGADGLARDLPLYLPGLSPTLSYASLSIKPALLSLFENHILALRPSSLRPALKAIILALLPGLEEETSEEFERTHSILIKLKIAVGRKHGDGSQQPELSSDQYYWQCLFLASITSPSRRQGALAFMVRNLPHVGKSSEESQLSAAHQSFNGTPQGLEGGAQSAVDAVTCPEPGLLVRAFAAGLHDEQLLIQRGFLDLLVTHLPLHSDVLQRKAPREDTDRLVAAAASVVARREMSLNRRLWTWFLGPDPISESQSGTPVTPLNPIPSDGVMPTPNYPGSSRTYFDRYSLDTLERSILNMIRSKSLAPSEKARPFRICLSLMDRWEIGAVVVPRLLLPLLESAWQYQSAAPSKESFEEVLRSASVFFDAVESGLIWGDIVRTLRSSLSNENTEGDRQSRLDLILFVITKFSIRDEEMQAVHIPMVIVMIVMYLQKNMKDSLGLVEGKSIELQQTALKIALTLIDTIPERSFVKAPATADLNGRTEAIAGFTESIQGFLDGVQDFYGQFQGSVGQAGAPYSSKQLNQLLLHNTVQVILQQLRAECQGKLFEMELSLMEKVTRRLPKPELEGNDRYLLALFEASKVISTQTEPPASIESIIALTSALEIFSNAMPTQFWFTSHHIRQIITELVQRLWPSLSPSKPSHNVETVRCVWRLQSVSPNVRLIEGCVATLIAEECFNMPNGEGELEAARRFATLWAHSSSSINSLRSRRPSLTNTRRLDPGDERSNPTPELVVLERPLMLLLDSLGNTGTKLSGFASSWLQSLPSLHVILHPLLHRLQTSRFLRSSLELTSSKADKPAPYDLGDLDECLYVLQTVTKLVICSPGNAWPSLTVNNGLLDTAPASDVSSTRIRSAPDGTMDDSTIQAYLIRVCMAILRDPLCEGDNMVARASFLRRVATSMLQQMLVGHSSIALPLSVIQDTVLEALAQSVKNADTLLQISLIDLLMVVLQTRSVNTGGTSESQHLRKTSGDYAKSLRRLSVSAERSEKDELSRASFTPPPALLDCLLLGLDSPNSYPVLEHWVRLLDDCLPFYAENAFHILMPIVECFNRTIKTVFTLMRAGFERQDVVMVAHEPLSTLQSLLSGLERSLARAHERLIQHEAGIVSLKTPEQSQGFFGNMVSGVFTAESSKSRRTTANNRLTVLLCFKDAIHVCLEIWTWGSHGQHGQSRDTTSSASLSYTSIRMKNRTRRILEHLFAAEALECLETLIEVWHQCRLQHDASRSSAVFNLLHVLDGSRPKNTIPALFNAMYSRTNPNALDPSRKSSLTADLSDITLADFLVFYMRSLEDDAMDEIWSDCMTFLKDVLANPLPHRQTLPRLLEFTAILGEKVDNTNFGEQRRMRRDLGELFVRLLAATFTAKPLSFTQEDAKSAESDGPNARHVGTYQHPHSDDIVSIVARILANLSKILVDTDRVAVASSTITAHILIPTIQSKTYPHNVSGSTLDILLALSRIPEASKTWRKVVAEAFNDPRFFCASSLSLAEEGWIPVLRQWTLLDKDRMQDYLSRLMPPTAAGIVFGVGASSARLEADRKTQLILRRVSLLVLAAADDTYVAAPISIQEKLLELLTATAASSPSSATRAELYMLLRAIVLKTSAVHMASFWPIIGSELYDALSSLFPGEQNDTYNIFCILEACKLLDTLVTLAPDDFQLREWLFITDTVDAVYRPPTWNPVALVDELVEELDSNAGAQDIASPPVVATAMHSGKRTPLLSCESIRAVPKEEIVDRVLHPFFRQLSINTFESTYSMETPDWKACYDGLLGDLFDDSTMT